MNFGMIVWNQNMVKMQNCYMDTDSFIVHVKTEDIYKDLAQDVEAKFDTSNFELPETIA